MTFDEILEQAIDMLRRRGRVSYGALKRQFALDDEYLVDLKNELIEVLAVAADQDGKLLVWKGTSAGVSPASKDTPPSLSADLSSTLAVTMRSIPDAERRQLTVMFCDLVGSTTLSQQLDPEEYHARVVAYQTACHQVIKRYEGHIAQYLGDGVLVYFGYPTAHEDDAVRAVRSGLEIVIAVGHLEYRPRLQIRIGIHTGPVVVGEIGVGEHTERLALGETPNVAARVQGIAEPDTVVMSQATSRLVQGLFECQDLGPQPLKGIITPLSLYRVIRESPARSRFEAAVSTGLIPLVGREEELRILQRRWTQAKDGSGHVVLLSGEAGIGKSRLMQEIKDLVSAEGATRIEFRCSPYHQNSALYPIIDHLHRLLQFTREDSSDIKLAKLHHVLARYRFPCAETLPLLATLLSLPQSEGALPLMLSPQRQKQMTQEALVAWLIEDAERTAVYCVWEDLHWADPSSLEVLSLFLDQVPTSRLLVLLTFRPDFLPPWRPRSSITQLTLNRLGRSQVEAMVERVTGGKALPTEMMQQIVRKTDGVPLFVEELTKVVLESGLLRDVNGHYELLGPLPPLAIPSTLQDSLMARLDRLAPVREVAQLGAILGREFSYELLHAISSLAEGPLQQGLRQLVEAELLYQHGLPPQATYLFKHALVQDTAYQSLLKSARQQSHRQVAQVLEARFAETVDTQPELVAHHYTEAGLIEQALPYWRKAGQRATQQSAYVEAIRHLMRGLEVLKLVPDTTERARHELTLQAALGAPLQATKGWTAPEVGQAYTRAQELCQQVGETPELFPILWGLFLFYGVRAEFQRQRELAEQLYNLAQRIQDPVLVLEAHLAMGTLLFHLAELTPAREHLERVIALYNLQQHRSLAFLYGTDPGVHCLSYASWVLWVLGYPDQALKRSQEALALAHELSHPFMLAFSLDYAATFHQFRRERQVVQEQAAAAMQLCAEQRFVYYLTCGSVLQGWALAEQDQGEEGVAQIRQAMATFRAIGAGIRQPLYLALLAEACGKVRQAEEGLSALCEALMLVDKTDQRWYEAELYRLKGELTLSQSSVPSLESRVKEAEECFWKAIEIARKQQAKSLELRAATSLARLWQQQGKRTEAHKLLSEVYNWFTEGLDTKDLQEAKALLVELT